MHILKFFGMQRLAPWFSELRKANRQKVETANSAVEFERKIEAYMRQFRDTTDEDQMYVCHFLGELHSSDKPEDVAAWRDAVSFLDRNYPEAVRVLSTLGRKKYANLFYDRAVKGIFEHQ